MTDYNPNLIPALNELVCADPQRPFLRNIHVRGHLVVVTNGFVMAALNWSRCGLDLSGLDNRRLSAAQWKALRSAKPKSNPRYALAPYGANGVRLTVASGLGEFSVDHDCDAAPLPRPVLSFYPEPDPDRLDGSPLIRVNPDVLLALTQGCRQASAKSGAPTMTLQIPAEATGHIVVLIRGVDESGLTVPLGTGLLLGVQMNETTLTEDMALWGRLKEGLS
jgi:hypothetical protein